MAGKTSVPQDVITDILSRLPVKSLIRFKAVSKTWRRLIQTPDFIASHLRFSTTNPALLVSRCKSDGKHLSMSLIDSVVSTTTTVDYLVLPFLNDTLQNFSVVGTINGLFCVTVSPSDDLFLLWNPATKAYRNFPKPLINTQCNTGNKTTLGFGYDCAADDYKLVRIVYTGSYLSSAQVEVLSWRTGSWRVLQDVDFPFKACDLTALPTVNGELFWCGEDDDDDGDDDFLLSFNLHDEVFRKVPKLEQVDDYEQGVMHCGKFEVWKESLAVIVFFEMTGVRNKLFDLLVLDDEAWRRVLRHELEPHPWFQFLELHTLWSDSEIMFKSSTGTMHFYDFNTKELKLNKRINIHGVSLNVSTFKYVPTLVSVYGGGQV